MRITEKKKERKSSESKDHKKEVRLIWLSNTALACFKHLLDTFLLIVSLNPHVQPSLISNTLSKRTLFKNNKFFQTNHYSLSLV